MKARWDTIVLAAMVVLITGFVCLVRVTLGPASLRVYLILGGLFTVPMLPLLVWRFKPSKLVIYMMMWLAFIVVESGTWTPRDRFLRDFHRIRSEMMMRQADQIMHRYQVGRTQGRYPYGRRSVYVYYHHDINDGAYNADIGEVTFRHGKVIGTRFMAD